MKPPPPMPQLYGSTTPSTRRPRSPRRRRSRLFFMTSIAAWVASGSTLAAAPREPSAVGVFSWAAATGAASSAATTAAGSQRIMPGPLPRRLRLQSEVDADHVGACGAAARLAHAGEVDRAVARRRRRQGVRDARGRPPPERLVDVAAGVVAARLVAGVAAGRGRGAVERAVRGGPPWLQEAGQDLLALVGRLDVGQAEAGDRRAAQLARAPRGAAAGGRRCSGRWTRCGRRSCRRAGCPRAPGGRRCRRRSGAGPGSRTAARRGWRPAVRQATQVAETATASAPGAGIDGPPSTWTVAPRT